MITAKINSVFFIIIDVRLTLFVLAEEKPAEYMLRDHEQDGETRVVELRGDVQVLRDRLAEKDKEIHQVCIAINQLIAISMYCNQCNSMYCNQIDCNTYKSIRTRTHCTRTHTHTHTRTHTHP